MADAYKVQRDEARAALELTKSTAARSIDEARGERDSLHTQIAKLRDWHREEARVHRRPIDLSGLSARKADEIHRQREIIAKREDQAADKLDALLSQQDAGRGPGSESSTALPGEDTDA
jgi:hypothetical protein